MAFHYDITTDTGKIRLLIADTEDCDHIFEDEEISAFYSLASDSIKRGAALALETMASNEAMVGKIKLLDLTLDGASISAELRARAKMLRAQADEDEARSTDEDELSWGIAEQIYDGHGYVQAHRNASLY